MPVLRDLLRGAAGDQQEQIQTFVRSGVVFALVPSEESLNIHHYEVEVDNSFTIHGAKVVGK